jgi:hypothetical protein
VQMPNPTSSREPETQIVLTLHSQSGLQVAVYPDPDQAKAAVIRLVRERGGDDGVKGLAVYNDGQMYEWTGSHESRRFYQYTIHLTEVSAGSWRRCTSRGSAVLKPWHSIGASVAALVMSGFGGSQTKSAIAAG